MHEHVNVDVDVDVLVHVDGLLQLSDPKAGTAESFRVSPPEVVVDPNANYWISPIPKAMQGAMKDCSFPIPEHL